jgi:serine/threonine protein phosphatase PrpC
MTAIDPDVPLPVPEALHCTACHSVIFEGERFCEACGTRLAPDPEVVTVDAPPVPASDERTEEDLGEAAAVTDRGLRRRRNEDAMAISTSEAGTVAVVCDGVASTANAHLASERAATAALAVLDAGIRSGGHGPGDSLQPLFARAFAAAQQAVTEVPVAEPDGRELSPSTTMVAVVTLPGAVHVANLGDSRAYWLGDHGTRLLTVDDSLAEELIGEGVDPVAAYANPEAHTITRWLGADAESIEPSVTEMAVDGPGRLVVCTDGLWNYFETPDRLAAVAGEAGAAALSTARRLVEAALAAGGHDNITVAVVSVGDLTPGDGEGGSRR